MNHSEEAFQTAEVTVCHRDSVSKPYCHNYSKMTINLFFSPLFFALLVFILLYLFIFFTIFIYGSAIFVLFYLTPYSLLSTVSFTLLFILQHFISYKLSAACFCSHGLHYNWSFTQILNEHLLCDRHCAKCYRYIRWWTKQKFLNAGWLCYICFQYIRFYLYSHRDFFLKL